MSGPPDNQELARQLAVLEERMNTQRAAAETGFERIERRLAEQAAEAARRETRLLLAVAGIIGLGIAILGFIG